MGLCGSTIKYVVKIVRQRMEDNPHAAQKIAFP